MRNEYIEAAEKLTKLAKKYELNKELSKLLVVGCSKVLKCGSENGEVLVKVAQNESKKIA